METKLSKHRYRPSTPPSWRTWSATQCMYKNWEWRVGEKCEVDKQCASASSTCQIRKPLCCAVHSVRQLTDKTYLTKQVKFNLRFLRYVKCNQSDPCKRLTFRQGMHEMYECNAVLRRTQMPYFSFARSMSTAAALRVGGTERQVLQFFSMLRERTVLG